ncbi:MAG TPA: hypothetical protein VNX01_01995 [Bacteroidia bacterium]|jgi:hypothetical protein|nr:hypothetical protein [Bacteroidia bacterium]
MNIQINEPCHENWQDMTPNQQGAFCKVCNKNVVDFSKKSITEIKSFFAEKAEGKICGRFEKKQLVYLSFDDFFNSFKYWALSKKFAVIFFFTFGFLSLTTNAQSQKHLTGKVAAPPTHLQGEAVATPTNTPVMGKPVINPNLYEKGDVAYPQKDTTKQQIKSTVKGNIKCINPPKQKKVQKINPAIMGMIVSPKSNEKKKD